MINTSKTSNISAGYNNHSKNAEGSSCEENAFNQSPFLMENIFEYKAWRDKKLSHYPVSFDGLLVKIDNLNRITPEEKFAILDRCKKYNMVVYQSHNPDCDPESLKTFALNFGLEKLDQHYCNDNNGITALQVSVKNNKGGFIPYSDKAISWHTDGYYNPLDQQVNTILLHCHTPANEGGDNSLMDHEIAYIRLRDENPAYIEALMDENAMTIPPHIEDGKELRGAQSGPVFSILKNGKGLHMRYSQRKHNIVWGEDPMLKEAVLFLNSLLSDNKQDMLHAKLNKGQGVICNNILHNRSAFVDTQEQSRLIYRARFFESIL